MEVDKCDGVGRRRRRNEKIDTAAPVPGTCDPKAPHDPRTSSARFVFWPRYACPRTGGVSRRVYARASALARPPVILSAAAVYFQRTRPRADPPDHRRRQNVTGRPTSCGSGRGRRRRRRHFPGDSKRRRFGGHDRPTVPCTRVPDIRGRGGGENQRALNISGPRSSTTLLAKGASPPAIRRSKSRRHPVYTHTHTSEAYI